MAYKPSEARYDLGGKAMYLVYQSPQPLNGNQLDMSAFLRLMATLP